MTPDRQLRQGLAALAIELSDKAQHLLLEYLALLAKWNRAYNLTAIREPGRLVSHHVLDSLSVLPCLPGSTLADVGSGAGLPGIPIAIARPEWSVTLIDSNHKKGAFLRQASIELKLANVTVVADRAERWVPPQPFDIVISRAFSDLSGFVDAGGHLCSRTGMLAAMKGVHPDEELSFLPADWQIERVAQLSVPGVGAARHLVLLRPAVEVHA